MHINIINVEVILPDIQAPSHRNEPVSLMEPMVLRQKSELTDLALELSIQATGLRRSLPPQIARSLSKIVRSMNCYYSNIIEGHHTHPIDIERALKNDYSTQSEKRNLQIEAVAHIKVQKWIDENGLQGNGASRSELLEIHRRFYEELPGEFLTVAFDGRDGTIQIKPGQWRETDIQVGHHIAISPSVLPKFLCRFEDVYTNLSKMDAIIAAAAAHHRLLWIHPFGDGNGRVARLMSYAMLRQSLNGEGLWSIARGLAKQSTIYKERLIGADTKRRSDLDGRGHLSEEGLVAFTRFFLETCIDQVQFMEKLMNPGRLQTRLSVWAAEEIRNGILPARADIILKFITINGCLPRSDIPELLSLTDRQTRRITSALTALEILTSPGPKAPFELNFPAVFAHRWLPGLFPDRNE